MTETCTVQFTVTVEVPLKQVNGTVEDAREMFISMAHEKLGYASPQSIQEGLAPGITAEIVTCSLPNITDNGE
jgi:hypothetical protein